MAYDESLAKRIELLIKSKKIPLNNKIGSGFTRKEMFGGVGFMYNGNMCVGVHQDELIIRNNPKSTVDLTKDKNVKPFNVYGRVMKGWSLVSPAGMAGDKLKKWFELSLEFVKTLPSKK